MLRNSRIAGIVALGLLAALALSQAGADVALHPLFTDHMVLQRGMKVPVWGTASPGEKVSVVLGDRRAKAKADAEGNWQVKLGAFDAGGPLSMLVSGQNNRVTVSDVLVGEVWIGSGQSNMAMSVKSSNNADEEIANAKFPSLRLFDVPRKVADTPQKTVEAVWQECTPETVPGFSAALYFFGRHLHNELDVPVGLIHTSWGGTPAESWTSIEKVQALPDCEPLLKRWDKILVDYPQAAAAHQKKIEEWKKTAQKAKAEGKDPGRPPRGPQGPDSPHRPANLYNAMIAPLVPYGIRGAIWYQGESNAGRAYQYRSLFPAMIEDWREIWDQPGKWEDFPFYFVQLANWRERKPEPAPSDWAELREAQTMTLSLKNTGQAVIIDIGDAKDIHPTNKQDVGKRLALNALNQVYGQDIPYSGPMYAGMKIDGPKVILRFQHADGGLVAKGGALKGFAVAGTDKAFVWADATIEGDTVVVSSDKVAEPVAVRYAWADNPECSLYNGADLPASPFRTDDWPGITIDSK
jgi:sialate O-acetylesterase